MTDQVSTESARNCLLLVERIAEKFGCPEAQKGNARAMAMTPADWAKLRKRGYSVARILTSPDIRPKPQRSIFDNSPRAGGHVVSPKLRAATLDAMLEITAHNGTPPRGTFRTIAKQHRVNYVSLMTRIQAERVAMRDAKRAA